MTTLPDWIVAILSFVIPGYGDPVAPFYNGYAEGNYLYVAAAAPGRIAGLEAVEGQTITAGTLLFWLEDTAQVTAVHSAQAQVAVAEANLVNLQTGGRSAEIDVIRASLEQAQADQHLAQTTLERSRQLLASGVQSQARVENDQAKVQSANARVAQLMAQLQVAELPARDAQRIAAQATLDAARSALDGAETALQDRKVLAPIGGLVDKVFYDSGEVVGVGSPVIAVLPPDSLTALFYIPEADRALVHPGDVFDISCNGCAPGLTATVSRLASSPQYTPPIIYSRDEVSRLVFRAEARIDVATGLLPGQPLQLSPHK